MFNEVTHIDARGQAKKINDGARDVLWEQVWEAVVRSNIVAAHLIHSLGLHQARADTADPNPLITLRSQISANNFGQMTHTMLSGRVDAGKVELHNWIDMTANAANVDDKAQLIVLLHESIGMPATQDQTG